ncbi:hypothetical protein B9Q02_07835 [Candidatus Marsarchaeota G1 archaeon BE_D]|uniref:Uncharacterized protein n=1 Tax=Candidatus Marsarchaeota G1 archaeon BE_D TaxID=1978156 RepID=A0A2R6AFC5_9ARCH|nr:MAG: hypothetical protein B9Q02_07835 [Candidatus Marsarchaeota G1 archaeon BE_D]
MGCIAAIFYEILVFTVGVDGAALTSVMLYTSLFRVPLFSFFVKSLTNVFSCFLALLGVYAIYSVTPSVFQVVVSLFTGLFYVLLINFPKPRLLRRGF